MSERNEFLDAFRDVPDPDAEREEQFQARHPELEEEEKEGTERARLQLQDEEQAEFDHGRIPEGADAEGHILFHQLPPEEQTRLYNKHGDMLYHGCQVFQNSLLAIDRGERVVDEAEEAIETFRAS